MRIEKLIGSKSRVLMLKYLCRNPGRDFSITELAKELDIDKSIISRTINFLEKEKIIENAKIEAEKITRRILQDHVLGRIK